MESTPNEQITYTYKLIKGGDDELYVSVGPLMKDIEKSIAQLMNIDVSSLNDDNKQIFDLKILGLKTIHQFLGALQMEQNLKDKASELKGTIPIKTTTNFTLTGASPNRTIH